MSCFDRLATNIFSRQCAAGAEQRLHPPILGGASHQAEYPDTPVPALPNEAQSPPAPPKIPQLLRFLASAK